MIYENSIRNGLNRNTIHHMNADVYHINNPFVKDVWMCGNEIATFLVMRITCPHSSLSARTTKFLFLLGLLVATFLVPGFIHAQNAVTGALTGVVTDSSGAVVPGADVKIVDTATNATINVKANEQGRYNAPLLKPSKYEITATANGLSSQRTTVQVTVGQTPNVDVTVAPSGNNTTVTVSAAAAQLTDTESPALITSLTPQQVQNLPAPGGDITTVAYTVPGVVVNTGGSYGNFSVDGIPGVSNLFVLNGGDDMDPFLNLNNSGSSNLTLGQQEVAEAAVVVNGYSGQYGRQAGAIVEWTTKSGSNGFHGNANYYYNGTALNANDWFNNQNGTPRPHAVANQWGISGGGPIIKDKLFFFTDYEGDRYVTPNVGVAAFTSPQFQAYTLANVPASSLPYYQQIFGLYQASPNYATAKPVTTGSGSLQSSPISNPYYGNPNYPNTPATVGTLGCGGNFGGTPAPGGGYFGFNPKDGSAGIPCTIASQGTANNLNKEWLYTARVDWHISDKHSLFGRYEMDHGSQPTSTSFVSPIFNTTSTQPSYNGQLNDTYTISPNISNQFIFSASWYTAFFGPANLNSTLAALPIYMQLNDGGTNAGTWGAVGLNNAFPQGRNVTQYQFVDDLSIVKGKHNLRFGYNFRRSDVSDYDNQSNEFGNYNILSLGDFASGTLSSGSSTYSQVFPVQGTAYIALYNLGAYLQDEYQVLPNLKLTFAARFDRNGDPLCNNNCFGLYNGGFPQGNVDATPPFSNAPYNQAILANRAHAFNNVEGVVFQPRFGFNYDVHGNGHTVVRGGFGIFEDNPAAIYVDGLIGNFPQVFNGTILAGNITAPNVAGGAPASAVASNATLQNGFGNGITPNQANALLTAQGASFAAPNLAVGPNTFRTPKYAEFNLQVQQQISHNDAIIIGYAGNVGYDELIYNQNINGSYAASGTPFGDLPAVSPDSRFGAVNLYTNAAHSNYNGGSVTYRRVDNHGLTLDASYTYSHSLDDVSNAGQPGTPTNANSITGQIDPYNLRRLNYASADYDVRHVFSMDFTYEEQWKSSKRLLTEVLGGWVVSGKSFWHTGEPFSVINSSLDSAVGGATLGANFLGAAINPATIPHDCQSVHNPCFSSSDFFTTATQTTMGNLPRNFFRAPHYADTDVSLAKDLYHREAINFRVGANAFNLWNHPNFAQPSNDLATGAGSITATAGPPTSPYGASASGVSGRVLQVFGKFSF